MKKGIKILFICALCTILFNTQTVFAENIYVSNNGIDIAQNYRPVDPSPGSDDTLDDVVTGVDKIWATIILIVQIVSVACVVIAGVRYMFASADKKADIKNGIMYLILGAIFVFAASTVIRFIFNIGNSVIQ